MGYRAWSLAHGNQDAGVSDRRCAEGSTWITSLGPLIGTKGYEVLAPILETQKLRPRESKLGSDGSGCKSVFM